MDLQNHINIQTPPTGPRSTRTRKIRNTAKKTLFKQVQDIVEPPGTTENPSSMKIDDTATNTDPFTASKKPDLDTPTTEELRLIKLRQNFETARTFEDDHIFFRYPHQTTLHDIEASNLYQRSASKNEAEKVGVQRDFHYSTYLSPAKGAAGGMHSLDPGARRFTPGQSAVPRRTFAVFRE